MVIQKEKDKKRYDELLSQGMRPSEALQKIAIESRGKTEENEGSRSRYQYSKHPGKSEYTFIGELKHLGKEVGREITEYPKRTLKEAAEDIETGRKYHEAYRQNKIEAASSRGAEAELRHHKEKVTKETDKHNREKAFRMERAKTAGRLVGRQQQYVVVGQPPRRRQWARPDFTPANIRPPNEFELDPMNIYSMRTTQTQQQTVPNSSVDLTYLHSLLGYYPNRITQPAQATPKLNTDFAQEMLGFNPNSRPESQPNGKQKAQPNGKQRKKRYNMFTGVWE